MDPVKAVLNGIMEAHGEGWQPAHYVVGIGLERFNEDGVIETSTYWVTPVEQAEYVTDGLLEAIHDQRSKAEWLPDE